MTFKVGDRVRVLEDGAYDAEVEAGEEGTVIKVDRPSYLGFGQKLQTKMDDGLTWFFLPEQLELVTQPFETKDSGARAEFSTGAVRDTQDGKGRYDLIPREPIHRWAQLMERGAVKYGDRNWEQGIPLSRMLSSALRHLYQLQAGMKDEDHAAAVLFNVGGFITIAERIEAGVLPKELDDLGFTA